MPEVVDGEVLNRHSERVGELYPACGYIGLEGGLGYADYMQRCILLYFLVIQQEVAYQEQCDHDDQGDM